MLCCTRKIFVSCCHVGYGPMKSGRWVSAQHTASIFTVPIETAFLPFWWNYKYDPGRVKWKYLKKILPQCHFSPYKSHMDWPGISQGLHGEMLATNCLSHGKAFNLWSGCHSSATYFWVLKWWMAIDLWKIWQFWCKLMCVNFWHGERGNFSIPFCLMLISNNHWS